MPRSLVGVGPVCHGVGRGFGWVRPRSQRLAEIQNAVWMLKKSGSTFERRCDLGDKGGLALSIKEDTKGLCPTLV